MATLRRKRRIDAEAWKAIKAGVDAGLFPAQIHRDIPEGIRPELRTVQRIWNELTPNTAAPWSLADSRDADEARVILEFLTHLIRLTEDRITSITLREADMLLKVKSVSADLGTTPVWGLVREYLRREDAGQDTRALDVWLAFKPWTWGPKRYQEYLDSGESELLRLVMREQYESWGTVFGRPAKGQPKDATD